MRKEIASALCVMTLIFCAEVAFPAWSTDPKVNTPVTRYHYNQSYPYLISDGSGGAIITWQDMRSWAFNDIFAQRLNSLGNALWAPDGVAVSSGPFDEYAPRLISDGSGGAIITWTENRVETDIYAQRLDSSGNSLWADRDMPVCTTGGYQWWPQITSDGSGGAIIAWHDLRNDPFESDIYAQRKDPAGNALWAAEGVPVCTATNSQINPQVVSDGAGGAIILWEDYRNGTETDIYAQRLDSSGNPLWPTDGVAVCIAINYQRTPQIISDGSGGVIIAWWDTGDTTDSDIYAQRLDISTGNALWPTNGVPVSQAKDAQSWGTPIYGTSNGNIVSDGSGGAIIAWEDGRSEAADIYAQRILPNGIPLWSADGVPVCTASGSQSFSQIISDGSGGAIITWQDMRSGSDDIYTQRLDSLGNALWAANGVAICTDTDIQWEPQLATDGEGGAIITWYDRRGDDGIYAQRINPDGSLGASPPPSPTEQASLIIPWYNDSGGSNLMASFISVFNPTSYNITLTVTYKAPSSVDATPQANTSILGPGEAKIGRPFQASGTGEKQESGPPYSMPNATSQGPFGSATFTAQVPAGSTIYGDVLRMGAIDLDGDGTLEPFSGIGPAFSQ